MNMNAMWSIRVGVVALMFAASSTPAGAQTYGGSATGATITVPATGTVLRAASETLSITGGGAEASLLVGDVPGSATGGVVAFAAGTLHSGVVGIDATRAEASLANISLTVSGNQISADFVMARAASTCGPAAAGSAQLENLVINSQPVTVTGAPNQTINLSNGTVVINQQSANIGGTSAELVVTAFRVTTRNTITNQELADVMLATADSRIDCASGTQAQASFGTGGGWVQGLSGGKATFGVTGGADQAGTKAHVVFKDHGAGFNMESTTEVVDNTTPCQTRITGTANSNLGVVEFIVTIQDNGEPGVDRDNFTIETSIGYTNSNLLGGGNIQKHHETCTTP